MRKTNKFVNLIFLFTKTGGESRGNSALQDFINIWPMHQWISTLIMLGIFYLIVLRLINKKVFNWRVGLILYLIDILLNILIDILVLYYGGPLFKMVIMCPLSLSPIIILIEGIIYYFFIHKHKNS